MGSLRDSQTAAHAKVRRSRGCDTLDIRSLTRVVTTSWTLVICATAMAQHPGPAEVVAARARELHARAIVIDAHDDTTMRMLSEPSFDVGARHSTGSIDIPR